MSKVIFIIRQDEHKDYDLALLEDYCKKLKDAGRAFTRVDDIPRSDGHKQTELNDG